MLGIINLDISELKQLISHQWEYGEISHHLYYKTYYVNVDLQNKNRIYLRIKKMDKRTSEYPTYFDFTKEFDLELAFKTDDNEYYDLINYLNNLEISKENIIKQSPIIQAVFKSTGGGMITDLQKQLINRYYSFLRMDKIKNILQ